jgi:hypothetical protein
MCLVQERDQWPHTVIVLREGGIENMSDYQLHKLVRYMDVL